MLSIECHFGRSDRAQVRSRLGLARLQLILQEIRYGDGGEYPDDDDDRIVVKLQT